MELFESLFPFSRESLANLHFVCLVSRTSSRLAAPRGPCTSTSTVISSFLCLRFRFASRHLNYKIQFTPFCATMWRGKLPLLCARSDASPLTPLNAGVEFYGAGEFHSFRAPVHVSRKLCRESDIMSELAPFKSCTSRIVAHCCSERKVYRVLCIPRARGLLHGRLFPRNMLSRRELATPGYLSWLTSAETL